MKIQTKALMGFILSLVVIYLIARPCATFMAELANKFVNKAEKDNIEKVNLSLPPYQYNSNSLDNTNPEHAFREHGFSVRFPVKPKIVNYGQIVQYDFSIENEPASYCILINTLSGLLLTNDSIDAHLDGYLLGRKKTLGSTGKLLKSQKVLFGDYRALDYEYIKVDQGFNAYYKGVHFTKGNISYTISVSCIEEIKDSAYQKYDEFVMSFRLLD